MTNTDKEEGAAAAAAASDKLKETEKKKRYRVKQLLGDVKKQVEFWFGDANLHKDRFLKKIIDESDDGYVDISVLTSFNRMKKLTTDPKLIARALKNSTVVEVNLEGNKVRRQHPLGDSPVNSDSCTVYVELLPKDVSHSWIERVFSKCGNVLYVSIPRYKSTGDSKGFAFVEFENEEQAQKAIEMLNNPPEDAPRKPGIFPKTLHRKPIPITGEEEEKKKRKKKKKKDASTARMSAGEVKEMETEAPQPKRKHSAAKESDKKLQSTEKEQTKVSEKKRRRSQTAEGSESEVPSKIRKTSHSESEEKEKEKSDLATEGDAEGDVEKGNENGDDSAVKAKRKRKKKHKEKLKIGEEVIPLRVLLKKEWLQLKQEYLALQKSSMSSLKRCINKIDSKEQGSTEDRSVKTKKENNQSPQFVSGVIMKITDSKPLPARKILKETLCQVSKVAYVDLLDGDSECYIRFCTPEGAKAVCDARAELQKEHSWKLEILAGDHEQRYWQKILVDRQVKLNRPREKRRGTEKLISKAEKIMMARAKEENKHIRFEED
ncbi:la-related protein 7 [Oryzias melastigma]|uniref:La-related protein 7 n=1 Tax=Oryzias melastigma TaxID=30732 RepID=A0A3B3BLG4_ORYME|nr:la-related protein 7 [Oryzias melastigma]XP_024144108.1 la-related protein 7 [Oryzias melastigma]